MALAVFIAPIMAAAQSLCTQGEVDYFSCRLADQRIISVCGIVHDEPTAQDWLQYRVGFHRRLEMAWPRERSGSVGKFEGNVFGPYSVSDLRFRIDSTDYGISVSRGGEDNRAGGFTRRAADEHVAREGHPDVVRKCVRPDVARYGRAFEDLNARLSNRRNAAGLP
jgi:hypothetical protein